MTTITTNELRSLLRQREGIKLDFKREMYQLDHQDKKVKTEHWDEFLKDLLALANGNSGYARDTGYLIVGVDNILKPDGTRDLLDIGADVKLEARQLIEKVNAACHPKMPDIRCEYISLDGNRILVTRIPPSPYLHETTRKLRAKNGKEYTEHTAFVRRTEGNYPGSQSEREAITDEKRSLFTKRFDVTPIVVAYKDRLALRGGL